MTGDHVGLVDKMTTFARTFPSLRELPGSTPWDARRLDRWAADTPLSPGELWTVRFVLSVWDASHPWQCGLFDLMEAYWVWDPNHRTAFLAWALDPWWP